MRRVIIFLAMVLAASVACASLTPASPSSGVKVAQLPDPKSGSWWVVTGSRDGSWKKKVELESVDVDKGLLIVSIDGRKTEYTREWNRTENVDDYRNIRDRYSFEEGFYRFPLQPGEPRRVWIVDWTGRRGLMSGGSFSGHSEVGQWERIEIRAGAFDAIKVSGQIGKTSLVCWYAPDLQISARCKYPLEPHRDWEVLEFELAQ